MNKGNIPTLTGSKTNPAEGLKRDSTRRVRFATPLVTQYIPPYTITGETDTESEPDLREVSAEATQDPDTREEMRSSPRRSTRLRERGSPKESNSEATPAGEWTKGLQNAVKRMHISTPPRSMVAEQVTTGEANPRTGELERQTRTTRTGGWKPQDTELGNEYVMDHIVDHDTVNGEVLHRIRWYGYGPQDDTWEPINHLPRNRVIQYYKRKRLEIPSTIGKARTG